MCEIKEQYRYFLDNKDALINRYKGKYIVISSAFDISAFPTRAEAYKFGATTYGLGNMLIQECSESAASRVRKFHSRVYR